MFPGGVEDNHSPSWNRRLDLDVYIPSEDIAIQYDGRRFHNDKKVNDDLKNGLQIIEHGIKLIRIREEGAPSIPDGSLEIRRNGVGRHSKSLNECIQALLQILSEMTGRIQDFSVDYDRDFCAIVDRSYTIALNNSISVKRPDLVPLIADNYEHPQKRDVLSRLPVNCNDKIWWTCPRCKNDHDLVVYSVTKYPPDKFPCRVDANKEIIEGQNDFAHTNIEEMKDWDWKENTANGFDPTKMSAGSNQGPIHWICHVPECRNRWTTTHLYQRTGNMAHGCPKCFEAKRKDRSRNRGSRYTIQYLLIIRDNPGVSGREIQKSLGTSIGATKSKLGSMVKLGEISYEKARKTKSGPDSYVYSITSKGLSILDKLNEEEISELAGSDISTRAPKKNVNDLTSWCISHNRTVLLDEWSSSNVDKPEEHRASDEDEIIWECHICGHVWESSIFSRTIRGHDCRKCYFRSRGEFELQCLRIIRDNPNISASVVSKELGKSIVVVSTKLKHLLDEGKIVRSKIDGCYLYSIADLGIKELGLFAKLGMNTEPYVVS